MDRDIQKVLEDLDESEMTKLLKKDMQFEIDSLVAERIKQAAFKKAGLEPEKSIHLIQKGSAIMKKKRRLSNQTKGLVTAAVVIFALAAVLNSDKVSATLDNWFKFNPSSGITQNNDKDVEFPENGRLILDKKSALTAENDQYHLALENAASVQDELLEVGVTTINKLKKNAQKSDAFSGITETPYVLYIGDQQYQDEGNGLTGSSESMVSGIPEFRVGKGNLNTNTVYKLVDTQNDLSVSFKLVDAESVQSLNEIGKTITHNNFGVTALPTYKNGKIMVELYPTGKDNGYHPYYYFADQQRLTQFGGVTLLTESGSKVGKTPDTTFNVDNKYAFDVNSTDKNFDLKVSALAIAHRTDTASTTIPVPEMGQKLPVNKDAQFKDGAITIVSVERIKDPEGENPNGAVKMTLKMKSKNEHMKLFDSLLVVGKYEHEYDENGVLNEIVYSPSNNAGEPMKFDNDLKLKFSWPIYKLTDTYNFNFTREDLK